MELADILSEDSVILCTGTRSKTEVLRQLAERAAEATRGDAGQIFEALSDREALGSTGLGNGIAIPHGKLAGLNGVTAVFVRLDTPIDFEAVDDQPVDLMMMLLAPVGAGADHLKALARVARLLRNESTVEALRRARNAGEIYAVLTQPVAATKAA
jgi:PTS system nitrogen regulatory IIA component